MATIDLSVVPVREANELIRKYGADGIDVEVLNPDARHHIGVGLTHPIKVAVRGSAGYFCAGLSDQARFHVQHNVGWGLGDNMYTGSVVVGGNAGAIPGVAIRGAEMKRAQETVHASNWMRHLKSACSPSGCICKAIGYLVCSF